MENVKIQWSQWILFPKNGDPVEFKLNGSDQVHTGRFLDGKFETENSDLEGAENVEFWRLASFDMQISKSA